MHLSNNFALQFVLLSCLLTCTNAQFRMINGENIRIERSPHSVAIFNTFPIDEYICVGALVNINSVVTAAHCVKDLEWRDLIVVAGVADVRQKNTERAQRRNVRRIYYDGDYNEKTLFMDVAVVKVDNSFQENNAVKSILLCHDPLLPGMPMQVSGWGTLNVNNRNTSPLLKTKSVQIANTQQCKTAYANRQISINLAETIMCAGCSGEDVCFGDSGAAAVLNRRLCAVVQGGCGNPDLPSLYTDVTNTRVRNFITSRMNRP